MTWKDKEDKAMDKDKYTPWPAQEDRAMWRAQIEMAKTRDMKKYKDFLVAHYRGRSNDLMRDIQRDLDRLVQAIAVGVPSYKHQLEASKGDMGKLWRTLIEIGKNDLSVIKDDQYWMALSQVARHFQDFELASWSAENAQIINPQSGKAGSD